MHVSGTEAPRPPSPCSFAAGEKGERLMCDTILSVAAAGEQRYGFVKSHPSAPLFASNDAPFGRRRRGAHILEQSRSWRAAGLPENPSATMGCLISKVHYDRVRAHIESAHKEGARLICGGGHPPQPELANDSRLVLSKNCEFAHVTGNGLSLRKSGVASPSRRTRPHDPPMKAAGNVWRRDPAGCPSKPRLPAMATLPSVDNQGIYQTPEKRL